MTVSIPSSNLLSMKIYFSNRDQFNKAVSIILHENTRLDSAKNLDIGYADMIFSFFDNYHFKRSVARLKEFKISDFSVDTEHSSE